MGRVGHQGNRALVERFTSFEEDVLLAAGQVDTHVEAGICFVEDHCVLRGVAANAMPPDLQILDRHERHRTKCKDHYIGPSHLDQGG